jgi:hypothetical protein
MGDGWDAGILAKLTRALQLRDELVAEQVRLRGPSGGLDVRQYLSTDNQSERENPICWMEWHLVAGPDPLPLSFSALMGDVIQNLRNALDYSAWAAATDAARRHNRAQISFPIFRKQKGYQSWFNTRDKWFGADTLKVMEASQPFKAPTNKLHPLRVLQVLSNTDKHQLLNVVDQAHVAQGIEFNPRPPVYDFETADGPVRPGDRLARLEYPRPPFRLEIDVMPSFGWNECVAFEEPGKPIEWLQLGDMMNAICSDVVDTVGYMAGARHGLKKAVDDVPRDPGGDN